MPVTAQGNRDKDLKVTENPLEIAGSTEIEEGRRITRSQMKKANVAVADLGPTGQPVAAAPSATKLAHGNISLEGSGKELKTEKEAAKVARHILCFEDKYPGEIPCRAVEIAQEVDTIKGTDFTEAEIDHTMRWKKDANSRVEAIDSLALWAVRSDTTEGQDQGEKQPIKRIASDEEEGCITKMEKESETLPIYSDSGSNDEVEGDVTNQEKERKKAYSRCDNSNDEDLPTDPARPAKLLSICSDHTRHKVTLKSRSFEHGFALFKVLQGKFIWVQCEFNKAAELVPAEEFADLAKLLPSLRSTSSKAYDKPDVRNRLIDSVAFGTWKGKVMLMARAYVGEELTLWSRTALGNGQKVKSELRQKVKEAGQTIPDCIKE